MCTASLESRLDDVESDASGNPLSGAKYQITCNGCGWFIREFLLGHGPNGSPRIDPDIDACQADIFYHYKTALLKAIALDRATRQEEQQARREKRAIDPERIARLTERYLARTPYKATGCLHS